MRKIVGLVAAMTLLGTAAACGDDGGGEGDLEAFCRLGAETDDSDEFPTSAELDELRDVAPAEIRGDVDTLVDAFQEIEDPEDFEAALEVLSTPEVAEASENIEAFVAENCDADTGGETTGGSDDEEDEDVTTTTADETTTTEDTTGDDEEGASGTLCDLLPDDVVSDAVGVDVSSADSFNNETSCTYESEDLAYRVSLGSIPDAFDQQADFFLATGETNAEEFEELEGIGDAAYFGVFGGAATASALSDGIVHAVNIDIPADDDPGSYRDAAAELLGELVEN